MSCVFCNGIEDSQIRMNTESFQVVYDIDPIQRGHLLIISKQHYENIREVPQPVLCELIRLEQQITEIIESNFDVQGVTIVQNNGHVMDEGTHFHVHIIPRYAGDGFWDHQMVEPHGLSLEKLTQCLSELNEC